MTLRKPEPLSTAPLSPTDTADLALQAPSVKRRMACWLYEGMLLFGVVFIAAYLFGTLSQTRHALDNRPGLQAFLFLTLGIYFTWFWYRGQTLAMKTWHIKVVSAQGVPLTQRRALLRYCLSWVWFLPPLLLTLPFDPSPGQVGLLTFVWVIVWAWISRFQAQRQFWHDIWAGTRLVTSR
jgi:uncharacterized RDD family membrane protein YckC